MCAPAWAPVLVGPRYDVGTYEGVVVKSKEEKAAAKAEKVARVNARFDAFKERMAAKQVGEKVIRQEAKAEVAEAGKAPTTLTLGGMLFPPLGAYQVVKMTAEQVQELNAMTPEERVEFTRRNPGFGSGG